MSDVKAGKSFATCGHELPPYDHGVQVVYPDWTCDALYGFQRCVVYATYCKECADRRKRNGGTLETKETQDRWLRDGKVRRPHD